LRKLIITGIFISALSFSVASQGTASSDTLVKIQGQLKNMVTGQSVPNAHVVNSGLGMGSTTDSLGFFTIAMRRDDSLRISVIGYHEMYFSLPAFWPSDHYTNVIYIREKSYLIEAVSVHGLGSYEQFKQKVLNADPPDPPAQENIRYLDKVVTEEAVKYDKVRVGFNFSVKSKEERSQAKLDDILEEQRKKQRIEEKFNAEMIRELTGLTGTRLRNFMDYCNLSEEFILYSSEYVILETVKQIFEEYKNINN
jgi:hypothetical protein